MEVARSNGFSHLMFIVDDRGPGAFKRLRRYYIRQELTMCREETAGQSCERVVLAKVPSFRFLGSRNLKSHSFLLLLLLLLLLPGSHCSERRQFQYRGTSAKTTLLETTLSRKKVMQTANKPGAIDSTHPEPKQIKNCLEFIRHIHASPTGKSKSRSVKCALHQRVNSKE